MELWQMFLGVIIMTLATLFVTPALWSSHVSLRKSERKKNPAK